MAEMSQRTVQVNNHDFNHHSQKQSLKVSEENQSVSIKKESHVSGAVYTKDGEIRETKTTAVYSSIAMTKISMDSSSPRKKTDEESIVISDVPLTGFHSRKQLDSIINGTFIDKFKPNHQLGPDYVAPAKTYFTINPNEAVLLRATETGPLSRKPVSLVTEMKNLVRENRDKPALSEKQNNEWVTLTYQEYWDQIQIITKAFIKLGLKQYHSVAMLGCNAPPWFISNFATIFAGGLSTGIYTTNSAEACEFILKHSQAQIVLVDGEKQLSKILQIRDNLPLLKAIIQYKGTPAHEDVFSWEDLIKIGQSMPEEPLQKRIKSLAINQCCSLVYTSGTTGTPKAVMLNHDNLVFTTATFNGKLYPENLLLEPIRVLSYLPLNHLAGQFTDMYATMFVAGHVFCALPDALKGSLKSTLQEVKPYILISVPRILEKIKEAIEDELSHMNTFKASYVKWSLKKIRKYTKSCTAGFPRKPVGYKMANSVVQKIREHIGLEKTEVFIIGGAPVVGDLINFFMGLNIVLLEGYGMSESTGPHITNLPQVYRAGSAGKLLPEFDIKITDPDEDGNGEICMKGRNVLMGYMFDKENTRSVLDDDGWLHSGDIGRLDSDNYLHITGRIKELIITAGGENVAPAPIEEAVRAELPLISQAVAIGDKRKYLSMLLTIKTIVDLEKLKPTNILTETSVRWCRSVGSDAKTVEDILKGPDMKVMKAIQNGIDRANEKAVSNVCRIRKWKILPKDFSLESGEISTTMKLKRHFILNRYKNVIDSIYA